MLIDSCASGGRRNDLETLRRAVPLLRSDYIMEPVGNQGHTYGLSYWIPYYGTGTRETDFLRAPQRALLRVHRLLRHAEQGDSITRASNARWTPGANTAKNFMSDYYPLTSYNIDSQNWIGWQFNTPERGEGVVQMFRRSESPYESIRVKLHDLEPGAVYKLTNLDVPGTVEVTGSELMEKGLSISIKDAPGSAIITYKKK